MAFIFDCTNTPYYFSACDVHFYHHFEVDLIIHGRMPPKAQQVIDEILMEAFISVTALSYTDESIHQTGKCQGFFFSPIMLSTSSHVSTTCRTTVVTNFPHLNSQPQIWGFTSNLCTFHLRIWIVMAELSDLKMFVPVGPVLKVWFGNTVHFVTSRYFFYEREVWIN